MLLTHASFEAPFPKDTIPGEPPGQPIAHLLRDGLSRAGIQAEAPANRDDFAWEFRATVDGHSFLVLVGLVDDEGGREWLVSVDSELGKLRRLFRKRDDAAHGVLLEAIHRALSGDERIRGLRWYTSVDWNTNPGEKWASEPGEGV